MVRRFQLLRGHGVPLLSGLLQQRPALLLEGGVARNEVGLISNAMRGEKPGACGAKPSPIEAILIFGASLKPFC